MVDRRWAEYGLADLQLGEVDPNLFGYDMRWQSIVSRKVDDLTVGRLKLLVRSTQYR